MMLVLTCALCAATPQAASGASVDRITLLESRLEVGGVSQPSPAVPLSLAWSHAGDQGAGDGDHSDHGSHMGPMWIVMGAMMVVMMVGMGVYFMRQAATGQSGAGALQTPAQAAVPVSVPRAGGG